MDTSWYSGMENVSLSELWGRCMGRGRCTNLPAARSVRPISMSANRGRIYKCSFSVSIFALATNGNVLELFGNKTLFIFTLVPPRPFLVLAHVRNGNISTACCSIEEGLLQEKTEVPSYAEQL